MKKNIYGILLGLCCGLLASMIWVLVYVYVGMISALCAIPIAKGIEIGYKKAKGEVDKKTPYIVAILTIIVVLVVCFLLIPIFLLIRYDYTVTIDNLNILYQDSEFMIALVKDSLISVLFAFLGMWGVIRQLRLESNPEVYQGQLKLQSEYDEKIKKLFISKKAFTKEKGISKEETDKFLKEHPEVLRTWLTLKQRGLIKKAKKVLYYPSIANEVKEKKTKKTN